MEQNAPPIARFRAGAVTCALWENKVDYGGKSSTVLKATISRRYCDRKGEWQTSQSFSRSDIPQAIFVLQKAFAAILERTGEDEIADAVEELSM